MFFQFFILGSWLPLVFGYLGSGGLDLTGAQQTAVLIAFPVSAMLAMFFGNQFADRNFAAEKFLAFSHLISGAALLGMCAATDFHVVRNLDVGSRLVLHANDFDHQFDRIGGDD